MQSEFHISQKVGRKGETKKMPERAWLKEGDDITLSRTKKGNNKIKFKIISVVGKGGSTVCYKASCDEAEDVLNSSVPKRGNLKEFYPEGLTSARRTKHNQLRFTCKGEQKQYQIASEDFVGAYQTLERVKKENVHNEVLNNYIPAYELYYSIEDGESPGVYIWTPDDQVGVGFDQYLSKVRDSLEEYPVHKLYNILSTILTLTDGICAIHKAGLLHLDIKPSNFLVTYNSQYEISPGKLSLFDINTFYSVYNDVPSISGTVGYRAPEVEKGRADNRSDIYSLGAVLFHAVIISNEVEEGGVLYRDEYYSQIDQLVSSSRLFKVSSVNDNIYLKSKIAKILKRCLAKKPSQRYECCEELIEDLKDTRIHLLTEKEKYGEGQRRFEWIEKVHPGKTCPTAIMQNLLFNQPLLEWIPQGSSNINVLVVGGGTYAQKFVDICLQLGQIPGYRLIIDVVSDEIDYDRNVYLQFRPALHRFVNLNDSLPGSSREVYADLNFGVECWSKEQRKDTEFSKFNFEQNQKNARKLIKKTTEDKAYHYIFIALGEDSFNRHVADAFVDACAEMEHPCLVNYVVETSDDKIHANRIKSDKINRSKNDGSETNKRKSLTRKMKTRMNPVYINAIIEPGTIHKDLERMAFNAHLLWKRPDKIDQKVVDEFYETYNYESSLSFALSIRYKLLSLGISDEDFEVASKKFVALIDGDATIYHQLIAYEHRRWVMDRLTQGWSSPISATGEFNFDKWVWQGNYRAKGKNGKVHLCIAHSSDERISLDKFWDRELNGADINELEAGEVEKNTTEHSITLDELDQVSVHLHQALKRAAERMKAENPDYKKDSPIREKIEAIGRNMYFNYKRYDEELVKEIPSILTKEIPSKINLHESFTSKDNKEYETYTPQPIDTKEVVLPEELEALTEKLSEHVHDIWALGRIEEGWRNGAIKDGELLINPCLVPYSELPDDEKQYDRDTALEALKLIVKMGYRIEKE